MIVFVSGGARSGKSDVAEQQVVNAAGSLPCYYLATANVYDAEMAARVARHRQSRQEEWQSAHWKTLEEPLVIDQAIAKVPKGSAVLLDCLTLWASQVLYASELSEEEGLALLASTLVDVRARSLYLVIVSNDINEALPPSDAETWRYLAFLQRVHRWLAKEADSVIEVIAGRAIEWKRNKERCV
ncbi:bifunctional adenosylcobinamide kinase/adenosylcobinamide-phosphate guanylyltransferase [Vreelandella indica]|mgnify:CR=1 FL=1|uniref:bifunctional adenosylcobinamide kinase/adenosylcobinamide-phosphate guanylyltransferase n=1 Tax=Vreelandella indica TaxID=3126500 RepID=UPI00300E535B